MNQSDIDELADNYRQIKAPEYLASKITANVEQEKIRRINWLPAFSSAFALGLITLFLVVPNGERALDNPARYSAVPSLTEASKLLAKKPSYSMPSLSSISGVSTHVVTPSKQNLLSKPNSEKSRSPENEQNQKQPSNSEQDDSIKRFI